MPEKDRWRQYTAADGLGDNFSYAVAVDRQGRVWAGSLNHSIAVFNGKAWKTYGILEGTLGERVNSIAVSPVDGDVWIGTDAGITRYSIHKDSWTNITRAEGLPGDSISALAFTPSGTLIAGTQADGIAIGSPADHYKTWRTVSGPAGMSSSPGGDGLPSSQVNCVLVSRAAGTIYVGTNFGLGRSEDGGKTFRYLRGAEWKDRVAGLFHGPKPVESNTRGFSLLEDDVTALAEDADGRLYTGYRKAGLEVSDPRTGNRLVQSGDDFVTAILLRPGRVPLVGHYGNGLSQAKLSLASSAVALMAVQPIHEASFPTPAPTPTAVLTPFCPVSFWTNWPDLPLRMKRFNLPGLPDVRTDPTATMAAVEKEMDSAPPVAKAALALWKTLDESTGREGEPELDRQALVMAYRALADGAAKGTWDSAAVQNLLSQWRRNIPLWTKRDRQQWKEAMVQARERLLKQNPQLAKLEP